ncbi:MAG: M14 family metallopeptidase [Myxococcota bacterium]
MGILSGYLDHEALHGAWMDVAARGRAQVLPVGRSVEGRPLTALQFGQPGAPSVMLTSLVHGDELVGGMALLRLLREMVERGDALLERFRFSILPIVNPDGVVATFRRMRRGRRLGRRQNAHGVDLNRNFGVVAELEKGHPFAGSRLPIAPHYMGPRAFSEPETRAVRKLVKLSRPRLSLSFHSFGNLLLYPWAFTRRPSLHARTYQALGEAFRSSQTRPYAVSQSCGFYPTLGDLDDWLEFEHGTRAITVEVSKPDASLFRSFGFLQPIRWMNPKNFEGALENLLPGVTGLLNGAAAQPALLRS